jgi:hypothetical protein
VREHLEDLRERAEQRADRQRSREPRTEAPGGGIP